MEKIESGGGRVRCGSLQECTTLGGELCREALQSGPWTTSQALHVLGRWELNLEARVRYRLSAAVRSQRSVVARAGRVCAVRLLVR
jgi:hypothetical protein